MRLYNDFARKPGPATLAPLQTALDDAAGRVPHGGEVVLNLMAQGARHFGELHGPGGFEDSNDIHVTAMIQCMAHWQARHGGPFEIVHDESNHFFERSERWRLLSDPCIEPQVITLGDKTLTLPIPVTSTTAGRSHEHPSLQLCDLVAGFVRWQAGPARTSDDRLFARDAIDTGMGGLSIFPVEARTEIVDGPPAKAAGPDIIDRIMAAARSGNAD